MEKKPISYLLLVNYVLPFHFFCCHWSTTKHIQEASSEQPAFMHRWAANYPAYHLSACGSVCVIWLKLKYHVWTRLHGGVMSFTARIRHVLKKAVRPREESRLLSLFWLCKKILCSVSVFLRHICLRHICLRHLPHNCACCMLILTKLLV